MRVLHVQKTKGIGGSERHLLALLPKLVEAGVEVRFCALVATGAEDFTDPLQAAGIPVRTIDAGGDFNPRLLAALVGEIRDYGPDLVHTHLIHGDLYGQAAARLVRVPAVSSVHGTHGFYERRPYRTLLGLAGHSAQRTIAISEHVGRFLEQLRLCREGSIRVVRYGIDAALWEGGSEERQKARAALGLGVDEIGVGVAARLVAHKGHEFMLEGFGQAARAEPRLRLLIAGDGPLRGELEELAGPLGVPVRFLGFIPAIREFMWGCDIVAFPSQPEFGEGFGLAALEAMAAGRPVVATAVASLPEVVGGPGSGVLIDPRDPDELARALVELARDGSRREQLGMAAHARARTDFSLEAMVEGTLGVYREAL